jgi:hypothetical protein
MRKLYAILFLSLILVIKTNGQGTDNPVLPRIYEDGYTIEQIESFAMQNTPYSKDYKVKLLVIINSGLRHSGEYVNINEGRPLNESHISWIYQRVKRNPNVHLPKGYKNTYKNGNKISPCNGTSDYNGPVDQFIFGQCVINLDKPSCANLLGDMEVLQFDPPAKQESSTTVFIKEKEETSSFVLPKNMSTLASMPVPYEQPNPISIPASKFNWKPVVIIGGATLVVGTGFLLYSLLKKANGGGPIDAPPVGGDEGGPQDGQPVGP